MTMKILRNELLSIACLFAATVAAAAEKPAPVKSTASAKSPAAALEVTPAAVKLTHPGRPQSVVVRTRTPLGQSIDLSREARLTVADPKVARISTSGGNGASWIEPIADGATEVTVVAAGGTAKIQVEVKLPAQSPPPSFRHDVMPVLSKAGCNQGACHGYSLGKNGFKLSLRGADPEADYLYVTDEFFERRVNRQNPPASLLLTKPLGDVPH